MAEFDRESMMEMFTFEMNQLLEQLEQNIIQGEAGFDQGQINEIFRIMHTIKGSAAMMMFDNISVTAHAIEDLFYFLREEKAPDNIDYSRIADLVLEGNDFVKAEITKIEEGVPADGDGSEIIKEIKAFMVALKSGTSVAEAPKEVKNELKQATTENVAATLSGAAHRYKVGLSFEDGSEMENIRAYNLVHNMKEDVSDLTHIPEDLIDENSIEFIRQKGFTMMFSSDKRYEEVHEMLSSTVYLKDLHLEELKEQTTSDKSDTFVYHAIIHFEDGCEMENVRAYTAVHNLKEHVVSVTHEPIDVVDEASIEIIRQNGFKMRIVSNKTYEEINTVLSSTIFLKELYLEEETMQKVEEDVRTNLETLEENVATVQVENTEKQASTPAPAAQQTQAAAQTAAATKKTAQQHVISVNVSKLDQLLNLMGELVIAEAMVTQNPELDDLELESFHKETRQLRKIINDVQDTVMSMRMVPLSTTFFKMNRIVRDMCKQLNKDVQLDIIGEETEVDKNIIEHISDPLMHIIRNSVDHGIENAERRQAAGKPSKGTVILEAKNSGGDVLIIVKDDGAGLNRDKILEKARNNGLLRKAESEYTDKEIHQFIFLPGFSTNDKVTSFSGRGVGMDVVSTNLELVGGTVIVDSTPGEGSTFVLKIPLTLAIIEGMTIRMGGAKYTIPIISIKESFKAKQGDVFADPNGNEMITVRGECYNIVRLYEFFNVDTDVRDIEEGIMIMLENGDQTVCVFVDELIGEQQVVVKSMPKYIKKIRGISGCTLLGNGDISLIIDVAGFFDK